MKTTKDTLAQMCSDYAQTLRAIVSGVDFVDYIDFDEDDEDEKALLAESVYERLNRYFEDALDVEFRVDLRGDYRGAKVALAVGGPGIYLDTRAGRISGYWGFGTHAEYFLDSATNDAIDEYWQEVWEVYHA